LSGAASDDEVFAREDTKALLNGLIGADGSRFVSVNGSRAMVHASSKSRRRCKCGCGGRATHIGLGDGVALMGGCEMRVRRWVRDGEAAYAADRRATLAAIGEAVAE